MRSNRLLDSFVLAAKGVQMFSGAASGIRHHIGSASCLQEIY